MLAWTHINVHVGAGSQHVLIFKLEAMILLVTQVVASEV